MEILKDLRFSSCSQAHSQDFTLGGTEAARVHFFFSKKVDARFSRRPQNLSSPSSGVYIFEAHKTLRIERTGGGIRPLNMILIH